MGARLKHWSTIAGAVAALAGAAVTVWRVRQELRARDNLSYSALNERLVRVEARLDVWQDLMISRDAHRLAAEPRPALPAPPASAESSAPASAPPPAQVEPVHAPRRPRASAGRVEPARAPPPAPAASETPRVAPATEPSTPLAPKQAAEQLRKAVQKRRAEAPRDLDALME